MLPIHPALLWFLPLAAVPILLHLLTLHRLRTVELSTFRFLFDSYVQQRRQMKFLEALLAALRALFLLLLVLVCSRPVVKQWSALFGGGAGRDIVMLVDCSASMNAQTAGLTSLERAKAAALAVVDRLARDDRLTLVRVAGRADEVFSRFSADTESIKQHIQDLEASPSRANWLVALSQLFAAGAPERSKTTVYLFTDCQASGWRELANQGLAGQGTGSLIPKETRLVVVNVGSKELLANRAVIGTAPREHRTVVGLPLTLRPRVANFSKSEPADVTVSVFVDDKEVARLPLTIKPGDSAEKEIIYVPTQPGTLRGRFQIGSDRFPDDDQYFFTLSIAPPIKVLLVNGNPANDPFENEGLYLRTALTARGEEAETLAPETRPPEPTTAEVSSSGSAPVSLAPSKEYVRSLHVQEVPEGNVNPETLRDAAVVILANCGQLNGQHFAWLRDYVSAGGGLIIFPGDRVNPDVYNREFFAVPGPLKERLIGATMGPPVGDAQKFDTFVQLTSLNDAHQVLSVFNDPDARYLTTANFYRRFPIVLEEESGNAWPLARFSPKEPALVESRFRDGRVLLAAFPATSKWTNLPLKPEFVPLTLRMVNYVEHRPDVEGPSVVPADGDAEIAVAANWAPVEGKITDAHRRATSLEFKRSGSRWVAGFEKTALAGYYSVDVRGGRVEQPKRDTTEFAVNLSPDESQFSLASEPQLREWLPDVDLSVVDASAETQQELGSLGDEREIWRWLLAVVFVVIGVEFMLATLGGRRSNQEELSVAERIREISPGTWAGRMTGAETVE
ncbi:MAG TPA: VWA domain-containing protein [Pirellulales bacterium]|nr:VWA domain-containing protein [Pirellulales bacterium]